jgi:hypothetical protein
MSPWGRVGVDLCPWHLSEQAAHHQKVSWIYLSHVGRPSIPGGPLHLVSYLILGLDS